MARIESRQCFGCGTIFDMITKEELDDHFHACVKHTMEARWTESSGRDDVELQRELFREFNPF